MDLSLEAHRLIVKYAGNRTDICNLCRVSRGFQCAAERALYNTIYMKNTADTVTLCNLLADRPRLAILVEALTIYVEDEENGDSDSSLVSSHPFWLAVSLGLQKVTRLRYFNIHMDRSWDSSAWILRNCTFRLRTFHCDLQWDDDLVSFLNNQPDIVDLFIVDYNASNRTFHSASSSDTSSLCPDALIDLSILECTFTEAACALVPNRPITRLKTCFSRTVLLEKREEMATLLSKLDLSTCPLVSLDIADSSYSEYFSMELLSSVVELQNLVQELHYLGTLVLPVIGSERLKFYGFLRRFPQLQCVEVDVSDWDPCPSNPAGLRALASELRLYCPSIARTIFVIDFERTVMTFVRGLYALDSNVISENAWRDV